MLKFEKINDEVMYTTEPITKVDADAVAFLKQQAAGNARRRIRLCGHPDADDLLHEMLIVHSRGNYVPPHRHHNKSESFHIIEGTLTVVIFNDDGEVREVIPMGTPGSEQTFFYRLSESLYHTVIPTSDLVVFHETTNGPFLREDMEFAPWAPAEDAPAENQDAFVQDLTRRFL